MKKEKAKKVVYYQDALHDDFAGTNIHTAVVDGDFRFIHTSFLWNACAFLLYYGLVVPLVWVFMRIFLRVKFVNRQAMKRLGPCYIYGNHTSFLDAFIPNLMSLPRRNRILVGPDTVSIQGIKNIVQMLGALPIPSTISGMKKFLQAVEHYSSTQNITIYPEAHIWPYYTGVRPFGDASFAYPVKSNSPVIAFFTAYTAPKGFCAWFRKANITVYISDPVYPDPTLTPREARKALRDKVYTFMETHTRYSTCEVIQYRKQEKQHTDA